MNRNADYYMRLELVVPPVAEPLTADEVRARLNISAEVSDETLNAFIMASRQVLDGATGWLNRALMTQTWRGYLDSFPDCNGNRLYIPLPPLQQLTAVSYTDSAGGTVSMVEDVDYRLRRQAQRPYITPIAPTWPGVMGTDAITLEFIAGYGDAGPDVPEPIRTAIALGVSYLRTVSMRNLMVTMEQEEGIGQTRYDNNPTGAGKVIDDAVQSLLSVYRVVEV